MCEYLINDALMLWENGSEGEIVKCCVMLRNVRNDTIDAYALQKKAFVSNK